MIHGRLFPFSASLLLVLGLTAANAATKQDAVPGEFLVKVKNANMMQSSNAVKAFGAESIRAVLKKQRVFLIKRNILERPDFAIASLKQNANVQVAERNLIYKVEKTPNDPLLGDLWGMKNTAQKGGREGIDIGAEAAWELSTGSRDVVVAVIDTGIDYTHPDIAANVWTNEAEANGQPGVDDDGNGFIDDIHGYNFVGDGTDGNPGNGNPMDDHGHGTHCSGTIGGTGDDGVGVVGVNWNVRIMGVKFLSAEGGGTLENAIKAIDYATMMGARIESNSWGGGEFTQLLYEAINRARDKGVLFVAAAGNGNYFGVGQDNDTEPSYPATYDSENIISVAAVDSAGQIAPFSNFGKTTVDIAAPGVDVTSSIPMALDTEDGVQDGHATWSGTSMATPHVSGIAALVLSLYPNLTVQELRARVLAGARPLGNWRNKVASGGIANAYYALSGETAPTDKDDPYFWSSQEKAMSSTHPYADKYTQEFEVKIDGAKQVALYFSKFQIEGTPDAAYDTVTFSDKDGNVIASWTGTHDDEFTPPIPGDTVKVKFTSDESVNMYGFDMTSVSYQMQDE